MYDLVILFGIPIEKEEYVARISASDYLRLYRSNPEKHWNTTYDKFIAEPFHEMAQQARGMTNCEVRTGATLKDLADVSKTAKVIVLVSHWKNYGFSNDDINRPIDGTKFIDAVSQADEPLAKWIRHALQKKQRDSKDTKSNLFFRWIESIQIIWKTDQTVRDILEQALDANIQSELPNIQGVSRHIESDLTRRTRRRNLMSQWFSSLVLPGNQLELFDGLYDRVTISQSIDKNFKGVLDLTVCTSTILADFISKEHQYCLRAVQFSKPQEPVWAAAVLKATLSLLSEGYGYLNARQEAIQLTRQIVYNRINTQENKSSLLRGNPIMTLKTLLSRQVSQWKEMGGEPVKVVAALSVYKKNIARQLIIKVVVSLVLLVSATYIAITLFYDQSALAVVMVAVIPIATSLVTDLFGTWKELNYSNLLLLLTQDATDEQIKGITDKLLEKL